jgi:deoxyribodipyrimidine photo-lyase
MYENGLFIFRRDYRLIDNIGLSTANKKCKNIYTIFIFTPEQVGNKNIYKSNNAVQFMIESLMDLEREINKSGGKLYTFYGSNKKIIKDCIEAFKINYVSFNKDYTPYALERDKEIVELCKDENIIIEMYQDYYLNEPGTIVSGSGEIYKKFTPFYNSALKIKIEEPMKKRKLKLKKSSSKITNEISLEEAINKFTTQNNNILVNGGRENGKKVLKIALKTQTHYNKTHNDLYKNTTNLSAYIKFGCFSIREIAHIFKSYHDIIRQIYWREFYASILYVYPFVLGKPMKSAYSKMRWHKNTRYLDLWKKGLTGFPVVDAGMRQMNITGYMHNRARLIVASFLIKTLLIDWREGEKYFATKLTDYDIASNNGNWQWTSGTGADSMPYFRIFSPWRQTEEFDPDCIYIKTWVPELREISNKEILNWETKWNKDVKYPKPIVNFKEQTKLALEMYKEVYS